MEKLPTLRGIGAFVYVATNWQTISADLEAYRRQIKDREEWAKTALEQKDALHGMAQEQLHRELDAWRATAEGNLQLAREAVEATKGLGASVVELKAALTKSEKTIGVFVDAWIDTGVLLARVLQREPPLTRLLLLNSLDELSRGMVDRMLERLPPPPPPLGLADLLPPSVGGMDVRAE